MNKHKIDPVILYEYQSTPLKEGQEEAIFKGFEEYASKVSKSGKILGKFPEDEVTRKGNTLKNNGSRVGIIKCSDECLLELHPKLDARENETFTWEFLPHMLETLFDYRDFDSKIFIDPQAEIILPEGFSFVPLLALSFVEILEDIIEHGVMKRYIRKDEEIKSIKGKINFTKQINKRAWDYSKIECSFNDLAIDNNENQIILWCGVKLLKKISLNKKTFSPIEKKLRAQVELLSTEITLEEKRLTDFNRVVLTANHSHYTDILKLCKVILSEKMFTTRENGKKTNIGVNFLIDMNWVFEQYMTHIFKKVIKENPKFKEFDIEDQKKGRLCDKGQIRIKPDLIITREKKAIAVIDFKWKSVESNNNSDFYQVICYSLAQLEQGNEHVKAHLFCASHDMKGIGLDTRLIQYDKIEDLFKMHDKNSKLKIEIGKVALCAGVFLKKHNEESSKEIEDNISKEVERYIEDFIAKGK